MTISAVGKMTSKNDLNGMPAGKGFTLIELALVMALLGLFFSALWPAFGSMYRNYLLDSAAEELRNCVAYARAGSITERRRYKLVWSGDFVRYALYRQEMKDGEASWVLPGGRWGRERTLADGLELQSERREVYFHPNGTCTDSAWLLKGPGGASLKIRLVGDLGDARIE